MEGTKFFYFSSPFRESVRGTHPFAKTAKGWGTLVYTVPRKGGPPAEGPRNHPNGGFWVDGKVTNITLFSNSDDVLLRGLDRDSQGYLTIQTGSAYVNVRDSIDQQIYNAPIGSTLDVIYQHQLQQLPRIGPQDPLDVALGCGAQVTVSVAKDVTGISLLNDVASALANGSIKPITGGDAATLAEKGLGRGGNNSTTRHAVSWIAKRVGSRVSTQTAGKAMRHMGAHAGALGAAISVYNAGDEFANCVQ
jgi:hypothetical protein